MPRAKSFEDAWRRYVNLATTTQDEADELLYDCLEAATTIDEMVQVFNVFYNDRGAQDSEIRPRALQKMIETVQTREEAERVYKLASKRSSHGLVFPSRYREAKAKLESFTTVS